ncbi:MAG: flippase-like domain-containing protein [Anaerolineae bacterium]|nr:flippase-like domain-containing protein [Anaerolineae bacterium]
MMTTWSERPLHLAKRHWGRLGAGMILGGLALAYAIHAVDGPALGRSLLNASPAWIGLAVAGALAVAGLKTGRWYQLYRLTGNEVAFGPLFSTLMAAQMLNLVIPIRVGELVRLGLMKRRGQPAGITLPTLIIEKALDLLTNGLLLWLLAMLSGVSISSRLASPAWGLLVVSFVILLGSVGLWQQRARIEALAAGLAHRSRRPNTAERGLAFLQRLLSGLGLLTGRQALAKVLGWTLVIWLASLLTIVALLSAFELHVPLTAAVLIMVGISFSNIFPSPPALVGLIPGLAVAALSLYSVPPAPALAFGLALNVVVVAPVIVLGSWAVWRELETVLGLIMERRSG